MTQPYEVPSQEGRTAVVTGATSGIGLWTALGLAKAGAKVVMVCRNAGRGADAKAFIARMRGVEPDIVLSDFADLTTVKRAAETIAGRYPKVDILVNNAGLFSPGRALTKDGYEMTFAVNHLAPFLLTNLLLPVLAAGGEPGRHARIATVASVAANRASVKIGDLMATQGYSMLGAYGQSKLCNILFTKELARRLPPRPISANCLHPGVVATRIGNTGGIVSLVWSAIKPFMIGPEQGAVNSLYVATSPELEAVSGSFFIKRKPVAGNPLSDDRQLAARLWEESEKLIERALGRSAAAA
jgi:NAD(P)-dependent dehydrogenase (short-subunit alcohol dehydrogenase family)